MRRREFLGIVGAMAAAGWSPGSLAQHISGKIGYLHPITISPGHISFSLLQKEWQRLGYIDGETVLARSGENDLRRLPGLIRDLTGLGVGVLIVVGADAVRTAAETAKNTPIVAIDLETDPVRTGLIGSYAKPGGNVTGLFLDVPLLATKWIELMRQMVPNLERVAFAWQPSTGRSQLDAALDAAQALSIEVTVVEIDAGDDFAARFSSLAGSKRTGIIQLTTPGAGTFADKFAVAADSHRLPTMTFLRTGAKAGFLMSYGPNQETYFPRAVQIADRILRGDSAADIPIERPTKFEFVINLRTAKMLGLQIPPMLLALADEVIE